MLSRINKRRAELQFLLRRNGKQNKDLEKQYKCKESLFITKALMSDLQLKYRLHIGDAWNHAHVGKFLACHESLQLQR